LVGWSAPAGKPRCRSSKALVAWDDREQDRQFLADLEIEGGGGGREQGGGDAQDEADGEQREKRGDRATKDQQQEYDDQRDRRDRDDLFGVGERLLVVQHDRGLAGDAGG
jgi:hypothetical protein